MRPWRHRRRARRDLLFYLKARGIPQKEAEALLIQSFVGEAIEGIEHAGPARGADGSRRGHVMARADSRRIRSRQRQL
jgi:hypothetical protein